MNNSSNIDRNRLATAPLSPWERAGERVRDEFCRAGSHRPSLGKAGRNRPYTCCARVSDPAPLDRGALTPLGHKHWFHSCEVGRPAHSAGAGSETRAQREESRAKRGARRSLNRSGIAAFELVILLPVICALIWVIFWFGFGMIYKNELTVECRREAWSKRYVEESQREWKSRPLLVFFIPELGIGRDQFVSASDTKKVSELKFFSDWSDVGSKHVVLAGSWDHREVDLTEPLSLKLPSAEWLAQASVYGKVGDPIILANTGMELYWRAEQALEGVDNTKNKIDNAYEMFSTDLFREAGVSLGADAMKNKIKEIVEEQFTPENLLNELVDTGLFDLLP